MSELAGGAGCAGAGEGPAGWDRTPEPGYRPGPTLVAAPLFDPQTKRYTMTAEGGLVAEHPVMARARHLLGIRRRGLPAAPSVGLPIAGIKAAHKDRKQRECEDAVKITLKPLLDDEDVIIVRVVLSTPFDGTFYTELKNLRAPNDPPARVASNLQE